MEKIERILTPTRFKVVTIIFLIAIIAACFYRSIILDSYPVTRQIPCDPQQGICFVSDCDSNDSTCTQTPYLKLTMQSHYAGNNYEALTDCTRTAAHCTITTCTPDTVEAGERCQ